MTAQASPAVTGLPGTPPPGQPAAMVAPVVPPLAPPPPSRWSPTPEPAPRIVLGCVALAALIGGITLPLDRPGIGWLLTGLAVAGGLAAIGLRLRRGLASAAVWVAPVALLAVGTVRAAEWLFALCVLTAVGVAAALLIRGRTAIGIGIGVPILVAACLLALPWGRRSVRSSLGDQRRTRSALRIIVAAAVGIALVMVFGALFASADPAFGAIITKVTPDLHVGSVVRWVFLGGLTGVTTLGGGYLLVNPADYGDVSVPPGRPLRRVEWALPMGLLAALFALFVAVQAAVLFGDREYVVRTAGLTFANYARRGFWQLLMVSLLTLVVLAVARRTAPRAGRGDRILTRALLGALCAGALVVVASALWRMWVYEQAYGFTRLRLWVSTFELWLGVLFLLVAAAAWSSTAWWLPRAILGTWVVLLLGLAVLNPDRFIAAHNVDRYLRTQRIDVVYLSELSADAVPELVRLTDSDQRACALGGVTYRMHTDPDPWYGYNVARAHARQVLDTSTSADGVRNETLPGCPP